MSFRGRGLASSVEPGTDIAGYRVVERLGAGGFGTVFLAERGHQRCALKLVPLEELGEWGERELLVLARVKHPNAARLLGHGYWPDKAPQYFVLVMEYVQGWRLDVWARVENPSVRQVASLVLDVARGLAAVHHAQAVHRDVKEANILVREGSGKAVLVDFGVGSYEEAPRVTDGVLPPGTPAYRSPEAWRFQREKGQGPAAHYTPGPKDDVYALGVVLYWLLTRTLPFPVEDWKGVESVLSSPPVAPQERNPRVPAPLEKLCLQLLEKAPELRPEAAALCGELEVLLAGAGTAWDEPLRAVPRLGDVAVIPTVGAPVSIKGWHAGASPQDRVALEAPTEPATWPPFSAGAPPGQEAPAKSGGPESRAAPQRPKRDAVLLLMIASLLGVGALSLKTRPSFPHEAALAEAPAQGDPTWQGGQKVADPANPAETVREGHSPKEAPEPAPGTKRPAPPEEIASMKTAPKKTSKAASALKKAVAVAACTTLACAGAPDVRPPPMAETSKAPPPEPCPPGTREAEEKLNIFPGVMFLVKFTGTAPSVMVVRDGPTELETLGNTRGVPDSSFLSGRLNIRNGRVYGRFTEVRTAKGERFPICVETFGNDGQRGVVIQSNEGPGAARISNASMAKVVSSFE